MLIEEALIFLRQGKQITNTNWNGFEDKVMYLTLQRPDKNSLMTIPYIVMNSGTFVDGGWVFEKGPWTPSQIDFNSGSWEIREEKIND